MHEPYIHGAYIYHPNSPTIQLIESCLFLESQLSLKGMTEFVKEASIGPKGMKKELTEKDRELLLSSAMEHQGTALASKIAAEVSWLKLWDTALE